MRTSHRKPTADDLLGKRYTWTDIRRRIPDFTIVAYDGRNNRLRVHMRDGARQWIALSVFVQAHYEGIVQECAFAGPFCFPQEH